MDNYRMFKCKIVAGSGPSFSVRWLEQMVHAAVGLQDEISICNSDMLQFSLTFICLSLLLVKPKCSTIQIPSNNYLI